MHSFFVKIQNAFYFLNFLVVELLLRLKSVKQNPYSMLLIRLDSIGDYILFRNFIEQVKKNNLYKDYTLSLCGNILWKNLAETFDNNVVNNFIWIDRNKFHKNIFYKYKILKSIREKGYEIVINSTYSREILFGDSIVKVSGAKKKIGCIGSLDSYMKWKRKLLTDKYYTKLIPASESNLFEFLRNKVFFEKLLEVKIDLRKPILPESVGNSSYSFDKKHAVLFPGAASSSRKWKRDYFFEILKYIIQHYDFLAVIAGGKNETEIAETLVSGLDESYIIDMTGKTTLPQLVDLIRNAKILISNDTGATHIAAAVDTSFVCVSNGNHFGRFHPYPQEIYDKAYYIYPPDIMNNLDNIELLKNKYRFSSDLNINEISPKTVIEVIKKVLG